MINMNFVFSMFQVCTKNTSDETDAPEGRSGLNKVDRLTELNNLILAEATDEVVEDERLFFPVEVNISLWFKGCKLSSKYRWEVW